MRARAHNDRGFPVWVVLMFLKCVGQQCGNLLGFLFGIRAGQELDPTSGVTAGSCSWIP